MPLRRRVAAFVTTRRLGSFAVLVAASASLNGPSGSGLKYPLHDSTEAKSEG